MPQGEQIIERLARLESLLTSLSLRLYGNGQPGDIQQIQTKVDGLRAWRWKVAGGTAVLGVLLTLAVHFVH